MERDIDNRMLKIINQNQEKENNSELLNNNLRFNYSSQPTLSNSFNFPSRSNIIRLKEAPAALNPDKKKLLTGQPHFDHRLKGSLDVAHKYRSSVQVVQPEPVATRSENDNYTEEYAAGLYDYLLTKDNRYGSFLRNHEVDHGLRARMVDWMVEVLTSYKCSNRTFFKTVDLMDRYFQLQSRSLPISKLHIVGVTSIYIATKIEQVYPIKLKTVQQKIAHKKLTQKDILDKQHDMLRAMSFNVLGESIFDLACILLCRLMVNQYVREMGVKFTDKKMVEVEDTVAHLAKATVFSYGILSSYPKHVIAGSLLLAALTANGFLNPFLHDRVAELVQHPQLQECYDELVKMLKEFGTRFPGLQNLRRFSKIDHEKIVSKL